MECGLKQWQAADILGMSNTSLCRKLRHELSEAEQDRIIAEIQKARPKDNKTPCSMCRFIGDDSGICDMCPAMPNERGAE